MNSSATSGFEIRAGPKTGPLQKSKALQRAWRNMNFGATYLKPFSGAPKQIRRCAHACETTEVRFSQKYLLPGEVGSATVCAGRAIRKAGAGSRPGGIAG